MFPSLFCPHDFLYLKVTYISAVLYAGQGNKWPGAEFNFRMDPEAAHIVLQEFQCKIMIMPWESCLHNGLPWVR